MRTNKLIEKAFDKAVPYTWDSLDYPEVDKLMKTLAELVVNECVAMIESEASTYSNPVWAYELVTDIREQFGVDK